MIAIVCIDDNNGMMFNNRRQSKDSVVRKNILKDISPAKLWLNKYSAKQFEPLYQSCLSVDDDFLLKCASREFAFVENLPLEGYTDKLEKIIIYRWNRKYPADFYFNIDISEHTWKLLSTEEFSGSSHEKITKEVYEKVC